MKRVIEWSRRPCCALMLLSWMGSACSEAIPHRQFAKDSGFQSSEVEGLQSSLGGTHYRMRLYRFTVNETQATVLRASVQPNEPNTSPWLNGVAQLVGTAESYLPNETRKWRWGALLPPYATQMLQCFPTKPPDFGFRYLKLQPSRAGKRRVLLAVGEQSSSAISQSCQSSAGNNAYGSANFEQLLLATGAKPYPFARRTLEEKLLLNYVPSYLDFASIIFVESDFWFRFSASEAQHAALLRRFALQKPEFDVHWGQRYGRPEWFNPGTDLLTRCWMDAKENMGTISAYWRDGTSVVLVSGNVGKWQKPCPK